MKQSPVPCSNLLMGARFCSTRFDAGFLLESTVSTDAEDSSHCCILLRHVTERRRKHKNGMPDERTPKFICTWSLITFFRIFFPGETYACKYSLYSGYMNLGLYLEINFDALSSDFDSIFKFSPPFCLNFPRKSFSPKS